MSLVVVGHTAHRQELTQLAAQSKLPHTLLFTGPSGIGKKRVAQELAARLLCQDPSAIKENSNGGCGNCNACHTFASGNHPDYYLVDCADKETGATARVRELLFSLNLKSFSSGSRVVIFDNAESLQVQAANALLKTFEEPRPNTYLILISASRSKLPPTLVSRCQLWFFDRLSSVELTQVIKATPELAEYLEQQEANVQTTLELADGSVDNVRMIFENIDWWSKTQQALTQIISGDYATALELAKELGQSKDTLRPRLGLIRAFIRQEMRHNSVSKNGLKYSLTLSNLIEADRLIFERNIGAGYVLLSAFFPLLSRPAEDLFIALPRDNLLLEEMTI